MHKRINHLMLRQPKAFSNLFLQLQNAGCRIWRRTARPPNEDCAAGQDGQLSRHRDFSPRNAGQWFKMVPAEPRNKKNGAWTEKHENTCNIAEGSQNPEK
jgi:hypothetical protein